MRKEESEETRASASCLWIATRDSGDILLSGVVVRVL